MHLKDLFTNSHFDPLYYLWVSFVFLVMRFLITFSKYVWSKLLWRLVENIVATEPF